MSKRQKFQIYLAGPISGCNNNQVRQWRNEVKSKYGGQLDFIDPAEMLKESSYEIVKTDLHAIEEANGLLVNMWRESIGSAIGIVHANQAGRPVVVANPNHLDNWILDFYADAVVETPLDAAQILLFLLHSEAGWSVMKYNGKEEEPFEHRKLMTAIRAACRDAGRNDVVVPRLIFPEVIKRLKKSRQKRFNAEGIDEEVIATFLNFEIEEVSREWKKHREEKKCSATSSQIPQEGEYSNSVVHIEITCGEKVHHSIWGNTVRDIRDIPSADARRVFESISRVPGITRIILSRSFSKKHRGSCIAEVKESDKPFVIHGRLFDKEGRRGTVQNFEVWVQFANQRKRTVDNIIANSKGFIRQWAR